MEISIHRSICHKDDKGRPQAMFSVSVNQQLDLVTGALDGTVSVWPAGCQQPSEWRGMARHDGACLVVRHYPLNEYDLFVSAGDDKRVVVWRKTLVVEGGGGSGVWRVTHRTSTAHHHSDISALEWTEDGQFLVSAGLDKLVNLWRFNRNTDELTLIGRFEAKGFVKGVSVCGRLVVVQSDDQQASVLLITPTAEDNYQLTKVGDITDCFTNASDNVFFTRPSICADGSMVALANTSNGPIPTACLVQLDPLTGQVVESAPIVSLVGHYGTVEVCRFSPRHYNGNSFLLATGAQDGSVAVWSSTRASPLAVLTDLSESSVTDCQWSHCGQFLFVSFYEGMVSKIALEVALTGPIGRPVMAMQPEKTHDEQVSDYLPPHGANDTTVVPNTSTNKQQAMVPSNRDGRKRVTPMLVSVSSGANTVKPQQQQPASSGGKRIMVTFACPSSTLNRFNRLQSNKSPWLFTNISVNDKTVNIEVLPSNSRVTCTDHSSMRLYWRIMLTPTVFSADSRITLAHHHADHLLLITNTLEMVVLNVFGQLCTPTCLLPAHPGHVHTYEHGVVLILIDGMIIHFGADYGRVETAIVPLSVLNIDKVSVNGNGHVSVNDEYTLVDGVWMKGSDHFDGSLVGIDQVKRLLSTSIDDTDMITGQQQRALYRLIM